MTINNNKFYLIATVARSFDTYHIKNNIIHLIFSIFYTETDLISNIAHYNTDKLLILRIIRENSDPIKVIEHNDTTIELHCSIMNFVSNSGKNGFENFIENLVGSHFALEKDKDNSLLSNNVLFVFEDTNWSTLQYIFKILSIQISGGSISRRHLLSTNHFNLSYLLYKMGYNKSDIYDSITCFNKYKSGDYNSDVLNLDKTMLISILSQELRISKEELMSRKNSVEKQIETLNGNISSLHTNLITALKLKGIEGGQLSSNKIHKLNKNIANLQRSVEYKTDSNTSINTKINAINDKLVQIHSITLEDLKDLYFKDYHNNKVRRNKTNLNNYISLIK